MDRRGKRVKKKAESPVETGRRWAEQRAETLSGEIPAVDWPDVWETYSDGKLDLPDKVSAREAEAYREAAHHAAAERWVALLKEHRDTEDVEEEEADEEAQALKLVQTLRGDLPRGWLVDHDGPRVYLLDDDGFETTVTSVADAWRVLSEWDEKYTSP